MNREAFGIEGFLHEPECELLATEAARVKNGYVVELGSYLGKSTGILASNTDKKTVVVSVDIWKNEENYKRFLTNINKWKDNIWIMRQPSSHLNHNDVNEFTNNVDLLFIDADHSEESVFNDLTAWYDMVKTGGVILMHDYTEKTSGVAKAVEKFFWTRPVSKTKIISSIMRIVK